MGEKQDGPFQLSFSASIDFQESRVTSDGALILVRALDEGWAFGDLIERTAEDLSESHQISEAD